MCSCCAKFAGAVQMAFNSLSHQMGRRDGHLGDARMLRAIGGLVVMRHGDSPAIMTSHAARVPCVGHVQLVAPDQRHDSCAPSRGAKIAAAGPCFGPLAAVTGSWFAWLCNSHVKENDSECEMNCTGKAAI